MPDLRLRSDRYLDLSAERAKAQRLAAISPDTNLRGVAEAYYAMTDDVDPARCRKFLAHILRAEARGEVLAQQLPSRGTSVELGCGTGGLLLAAHRRGLSISGADIASRWLVVARRRLQDAGVSLPLVAADAESLPWPSGSVDCVVADSLIEHLDDPSAALRECWRILRPGGTLILWSPNRLSLLPDPHVRLWGVGFLPRRWSQRYVGLRRGGAWLPKVRTASEAGNLARAAGFSDVVVSPVDLQGFGSQPGSRVARLSFAAYRRVRDHPLGFSLLRLFGPLWMLSARKRDLT